MAAVGHMAIRRLPDLKTKWTRNMCDLCTKTKIGAGNPFLNIFLGFEYSEGSKFNMAAITYSRVILGGSVTILFKTMFLDGFRYLR